MKRNWFILLIVCLLVLAGCGQLPTGTSTPSTESDIGDIKILSHSGYHITGGFTGDYLDIFGELKNTGTQNIDFVGVIITCYNAEGKVISASGTTLLTDLEAGGIASFDSTVLPKQISSDIVSYTLQTDVSD